MLHMRTLNVYSKNRSTLSTMQSMLRKVKCLYTANKGCRGLSPYAWLTICICTIYLNRTVSSVCAIPGAYATPTWALQCSWWCFKTGCTVITTRLLMYPGCLPLVGFNSNSQLRSYVDFSWIRISKRLKNIQRILKFLIPEVCKLFLMKAKITYG